MTSTDLKSTDTPVVLVAVDDTDTSRRALSWAISEAQRLGAVVEVVTTYDAASGPEARELAQQAQDRVVRQGGHDQPIPGLVHHVVAGDPVDTLVLMSSRAHVLVMGRHSTTGLRHSAQPSTAERCARLADCPVTIVPGPHVLP